MVPNVGDYHSLEWLDNARVLVRNAEGIELLSNICRHRQAIMLQGRGTVRNIVCPIHRWTYALDGKLLGAPHFPRNPCLDLNKSRLTSWNGLLFAGTRDVAADLASMDVAAKLDFSGFVFDRALVEEYACNWKTFIEVYLEDYHVEPFHPGLGNFVDVSDLRWQFGHWYSVQTCGVRNRLAKAGSAVYQRWHEEVLRCGEGNQPAHGAIWLTYFPNIMVEWYPHSLVVSTLVPRGPEDVRTSSSSTIPKRSALRARVRRGGTGGISGDRDRRRRDHRANQRGTPGSRPASADRGGPYQSPLEDGMQHFHEFIRRELSPHVHDARHGR